MNEWDQGKAEDAARDVAEQLERVWREEVKRDPAGGIWWPDDEEDFNEDDWADLEEADFNDWVDDVDPEDFWWTFDDSRRLVGVTILIRSHDPLIAVDTRRREVQANCWGSTAVEHLDRKLCDRMLDELAPHFWVR